MSLEFSENGLIEILTLPRGPFKHKELKIGVSERALIIINQLLKFEKCLSEGLKWILDQVKYFCLLDVT